MKITAYKVGKNPLELIPGDKKRDWMDNTPGSYAYRCLPLSIANSYGWIAKNTQDLLVDWTGGVDRNDLSIKCINPDVDYASSIFGSGILTIHLGYLFQTEKGWDMMVSGPPNFFNDHMDAMSGIVETFWLPFTFTMNWKVRSPGRFVIPAGFPLCHFYPIKHQMDIDAEMVSIESNPDLKEKYNKWSNTRWQTNKFINNIRQGGKPPEGIKPENLWEKSYYIGEDKDKVKENDHIIKRRFPKFINKQ